MARLIDADARVTVQSFDPMNEEYYHNEMTVEQALDFATDEGCPPIVAAIPIEWLEGLLLSTDDDVDKVEFAWIMREWQEEQEAQGT